MKSASETRRLTGPMPSPEGVARKEIIEARSVMEEELVATVQQRLEAMGPVTQPKIFDIIADSIEKAGSEMNLHPAGIISALRKLGIHHTRSLREQKRNASNK